MEGANQLISYTDIKLNKIDLYDIGNLIRYKYKNTEIIVNQQSKTIRVKGKECMNATFELN